MFRIYYDDGSTYAGDPFEAASHGVIAVVVRRNGKPLVWHSRDAYYWHKEMGWTPCDDWGYRDYMLNYIGPKAVLFGRNVRDEQYWAIIKRAIAEGLGK